ncbi:MAG: 50S ribosomal protein L22 [Bacilli bacterium]|nr:50S ribosomal protein L22 [Bacilli bacterium]
MAETKKKTVKAKKAEQPVEEAPVEKKPAKKAAKKAAAPKKAEVKKAEPVKEEKPAVKEAIATVRDIRVTPRKVRLVIDLVRGKDVAEALGILARVNRAASLPVSKLIRSAAANATNNFGLNAEKLYVAEIQASDGLKMKRYMPRGKGSSSPLIKRMSNIRVVVKER